MIAQTFRVVITLDATDHCNQNCPFRQNRICKLTNEELIFNGGFERTEICMEGGVVEIKVR